MIQPSAFRQSPADLPGSGRRTRCPTARYTTPGDTIDNTVKAKPSTEAAQQATDISSRGRHYRSCRHYGYRNYRPHYGNSYGYYQPRPYYGGGYGRGYGQPYYGGGGYGGPGISFGFGGNRW